MVGRVISLSCVPCHKDKRSVFLYGLFDSVAIFISRRCAPCRTEDSSSGRCLFHATEIVLVIASGTIRPRTRRSSSTLGVVELIRVVGNPTVAAAAAAVSRRSSLVQSQFLISNAIKPILRPRSPKPHVVFGTSIITFCPE